MNQKYIVIIFAVLTILGLSAAGINSLKETLTEGSATPTPTKGVTINFGGDKQIQTPSPTQNQNTNTAKYYRQFPGNLAPEELKNKKADIETDKGTISFEIYPEATKSASNFIFLAKDGFYDGLTFHRVEPGFVIQGGDPAGNGTGGPGYTFKEDNVSGKYDRGIVAMAKRADESAGTGGSQFFIMLADTQLPPEYAIFGKVIRGQEVVDKIQMGDVMRKITISSI